MKNLRFKTNINCDSCIKSVKSFLDDAVGENNWEVDTKDENKILTVTTNEDEEEVIEAVNDAGFKIQKI